jgi:hypothetical protein
VEDRVMRNIQQSVIRFDPNACVGFSAPPDGSSDRRQGFGSS